MDNSEALRQWNGAASGWTKWEPVHNKALAAATEIMLDRAGVTSGSRVVDIACGAGDQSLAAARRAGPTGYVLATDISPLMLDFVTGQAREAGFGNIGTHACPAEALPRDQAPFDAAICRLGLMLLPDPPAAVVAVRDSLRPGGRFGALVFAPAAMNPAHAEPIAILRRHAGKPAPAAGPGLFALAETTKLSALLEDAGFADVSVTTEDTAMTLGSAGEMIQMIKEAFGAVRGIIADQPQEVQDAAWAEVRGALLRFEGAEGFVAPCRFHVVGGRKPG
jgi:SAM-dependent methyltransferase